jgi:transposase
MRHDTHSEGGGPFELEVARLGPLPILNHFFAKLALEEAFEAYVPGGDARQKVPPASVLGVVVRNLLVEKVPAYAVGEWAAAYEPALVGLSRSEAGLLNDDRVGRALDRLFDADRASLLTEVVLAAVRAFGIDCSQLHNDSTTVTFSGDYRGADGRPRGGKATAGITFGYNKDHRPDLRQLVFILTVSADGAVPVAHRVAPGNTEDSTTHVRSWDELVALVGRHDFLYVADCKLATREAMEHIDSGGGRFVTVLPRSRREDAWFRDWVTCHRPSWSEATRRPGRRRGEGDDVTSVFEAPLPTAEGYRVIWVHSTHKRDNDAATRSRRLTRSTAALEDLASRLSGPKCRITTRVAVEEAARAILDEYDVARYFELKVAEARDKTYRAEHRGSPGQSTRFRQHVKVRFVLSWRLLSHVVRRQAASDGCFPLVTNDPVLAPSQVLAAYKYQPNLERRNHCLKGPQAVAPVNLHSPARIEALLCCHFLALLVSALIERQIRHAMARANTPTIPLYPEERDCAAPSAERILEVFAGLERHHLIEDGRVIEVFEPKLTPLQQQLLRLLGIPQRAYRSG